MSPKPEQPATLPVPFDDAIFARAKALQAASDQRPSAGGFSAAAYEIDKRGAWQNTKDEGDKKDSIVFVPLMLRETRSYWARPSGDGPASPPDCRSIDGLKPLKMPDLEPQSAECQPCPWNRFNTAEKGKGKKCKTKGSLFGLELTPDAKRIIGPIMLRFSLSNGPVNDAIASADRQAAALGRPRILTIWKATTKVAKGRSEDFLHFAPEVIGPVNDNELARVIVETTEALNGGQADAILTGSMDRAAD